MEVRSRRLGPTAIVYRGRSMIISAIVKKDEIKGDHILIISKDECHTIQNVFTKFCEEHKRMKKAKEMSKEFDENFQIW